MRAVAIACLMFALGTPDEIAAKLDRLRAAGIEHVLLNGAGGAVANLRRFAHEVMPAYSGEKRAAAAE